MKEGADQKDPGKLELIATKSFPPYGDMYRVVDFLNKSLKDKKIMFGLTKDRQSGMMTITIYEV
ncbi:MAG: YpmA family protein [Bacillota bacterium]